MAGKPEETWGEAFRSVWGALVLNRRRLWLTKDGWPLDKVGEIPPWMEEVDVRLNDVGSCMGGMAGYPPGFDIQLYRVKP